jgi:hypothetical protein
VARDGTSFRCARCKIYKGILNPLIIEALALQDSFIYSVDRGFQQVLAEADRSVIKPILDEISELSSCLLFLVLCSRLVKLTR